MKNVPKNSTSRFCRDTRGGISIETLIILPMLFWALVATLVFFDGFRARNQTQVAAQTVADLLSRETHMFTMNYLEGMNDVFDFISGSRFPTRMRISSIIWNSTDEINRLQWSYGTRNLAPLPDDTFELLAAGDFATLQARFGANSEFGFIGSAAQAPRPDLAERIPPVLPGEALILVESMALWSPWFNVGLGNMRFDPVVVTRPRFTPWVHLEGAIPVYPEDNYEVAIAGYNPDLPEPDDDQPIAGQTVTVVAQDFESGTGPGWSRTPVTVTQRAGTGSFLGPFGQETWNTPLTFGVDLGANQMESARIEFDLLILDSWDGYVTQWSHPEGDSLSILIDGVPISLDVFWHERGGRFTENSRTAVVNHDGSVFHLNMDRIQFGTNFYGANWEDQIWRVTLDIQAPKQTFSLGFSARLSNNIANEAFGIDNFWITGTVGTAVPAAFVADPATLSGTFARTRFPRHQGCPDFRLSTNWMTIRNADLWENVTFRRRARGTRDLNTCGGVNGSRFADASPHFVLNYTNDTSNINGNRLRIRTEDNNNGQTCDSTLLVRDPNGQWWFNSEITDTNWNARLNMNHAQTGVYHIWVGRWNFGECGSDVAVTFQRY